MPPDIPTGWYSDSDDSNLDRYWDGASWTEYTRPSERLPPPPAPAPLHTLPPPPPGAGEYQQPPFDPEGYQQTPFDGSGRFADMPEPTMPRTRTKTSKSALSGAAAVVLFIGVRLVLPLVFSNIDTTTTTTPCCAYTTVPNTVTVDSQPQTGVTAVGPISMNYATVWAPADQGGVSGAVFAVLTNTSDQTVTGDVTVTVLVAKGKAFGEAKFHVDLLQAGASFGTEASFFLERATEPPDSELIFSFAPGRSDGQIPPGSFDVSNLKLQIDKGRMSLPGIKLVGTLKSSFGVDANRVTLQVLYFDTGGQVRAGGSVLVVQVPAHGSLDVDERLSLDPTPPELAYRVYANARPYDFMK